MGVMARLGYHTNLGSWYFGTVVAMVPVVWAVECALHVSHFHANTLGSSFRFIQSRQVEAPKPERDDLVSRVCDLRLQIPLYASNFRTYKVHSSR